MPIERENGLGMRGWRGRGKRKENMLRETEIEKAIHLHTCLLDLVRVARIGAGSIVGQGLRPHELVVRRRGGDDVAVAGDLPRKPRYRPGDCGPQRMSVIAFFSDGLELLLLLLLVVQNSSCAHLGISPRRGPRRGSGLWGSWGSWGGRGRFLQWRGFSC